LPRAPKPSTAIEPAERDLYFESLFRDREPLVEAFGIGFDPSEVLQLDPGAYQEARQELLSDATVEIQGALSETSFRRLGRLAGQIPKGRVVPFVGAGMSASSGYPTWSGFLRAEAEEWMDVGEVETFLAEQDFEGFARALQAARGVHGFEECIGTFDRGLLPSEELYLIADIFKEGIVTTNFDDLVERALRDSEGDAHVIEGSGAWSGWASEGRSGAERLVLKLHGHHSRPNFRVLLEDEYEAAYSDSGPVRRDLRDLFAASSLVFVGCSLTQDRTMQIGLEVQSERQIGSSPRHYAFLAKEAGYQARELFLAERGIFPIWYDNQSEDHRLLGLMLWWLRDATANGS
jgi:hypothetical protein